MAKSGVEHLAQHPGWKTRAHQRKRRKQKVKDDVPVIFVEGGVVQDVIHVDGKKRKGYRPAKYELVDYDIFEGEPDSDIFLHWQGFSPKLKAYFKCYLPDEYKKFMDAIERITVEAEKQPKSHSADLNEEETV